MGVAVLVPAPPVEAQVCEGVEACVEGHFSRN